MREDRRKFLMRGKQNHGAWPGRQYSLNDLLPFLLHPAGCRRLTSGLSVGARHIYLTDLGLIESRLVSMILIIILICATFLL